MPRPALVLARNLLVGACLALVVAGCGALAAGSPAPTPADFQGIASELAKRGIGVTHIVSGDPGCADPVLTPTAIAFDATGLDQPEAVRIYIYIFRNRATFERLRASIDSCAASFVSDADTYESVEASPFVVAGQGPWGIEFERALRAGLTVAAGSGG